MKIFAHISWLFATIAIFISLFFMILSYLVFPRPINRKITAWIVRYSIFCSTEVVGKEDPEAQMFLLNHQSDLDIGVMETITKKNLAWVGSFLNVNGQININHVLAEDPLTLLSTFPLSFLLLFLSHYLDKV